jgi:hypothetical protein
MKINFENCKDTLTNVLFAKKGYVFVMYGIITSLICVQLIKYAPPLIYDSSQYWDLSDSLIKANLNIFTFDFDIRTFVQPFYLAILKIVANYLYLNPRFFIFGVNIVLFHFTNLLIYFVAKRFSEKSANIFLILSSFNYITLSFANTFLTENLAIFFTATLFFLLTKNSKKFLDLFLVGLISSLFVYTRPSSLLLFFAIALFVIVFTLVKKRAYKLLIAYLIGVSLIFSIGLINTYNIEKKIAFFTSPTRGIYDMQIRLGIMIIKFEGSIDKTFSDTTLIYFNNKNNDTMASMCRLVPALDCFKKYLIKDPFGYALSVSMHLFNIFDRRYWQTYIADVRHDNLILQFCNYVILTGALIYLLLFKIKNKYFPFIFTALYLIFFTLLIYIPTVVEPRFSAPIFPLIVLIFSIFVNNFSKLPSWTTKMRYISIIAVLVICCFIMSELTQLTLYNGRKAVYQQSTISF